MKKSSLISVMLFIAVSVFSQPPQSFKYQAVARDAGGNLLSSQNVTFRISILQGSAGGASVYSETHAVITNDFGLANLNIGVGTPVSGNFSTIGWGMNTFFIKVELDPLGGSAYQLMGTSQLLSVPYALYARNSADGVGSGTAGQTLRHNGTSWLATSNLYNNGTNIGIGTLSPAAKLHVESPSFTSKLATTSQGVYGEHSISGSYGWLGASNEGGYGYSPNGYGLRGQTTNGYAFYGDHSASGNSGWIGSATEGVYGSSASGSGVKGNTTSGYAIHGTSTGSGFAGHFTGKTHVTGNLGINETSPNRALYVSDLQSGLSYPLKLENKHSILSEAAVGILFSTGGSGTTERGKGALVYQYTDSWNRGAFHFLQNTQPSNTNPTLSNAVMTITNSGNVGIGTANPGARLEVAANAGPNLIIHDANGGNDRPGIQFTNNNIHYFSGDDGSDEQFGFYSGYGNNRTYDAILAIFGKATNNWGKYLAITHNGTSGRIFTDAGDLLLQPAGGVAINTSSAGTYKLNVSGDVYISGNIHTSSKTDAIIISTSEFLPIYNTISYNNFGSSLTSEGDFVAPVHLPNNAIVTNITSYWIDNSAFAASLRLRRNDFYNNVTVLMSEIVTNMQNTTRTALSDNTIDYSTIGNSNYMYYFTLTLIPNVVFFGAKIEYTYDELK
jgi:hypothetical protein